MSSQRVTRPASTVIDLVSDMWLVFIIPLAIAVLAVFTYAGAPTVYTHSVPHTPTISAPASPLVTGALAGIQLGTDVRS